METKKVRHYTDTSLGFPVLIGNVTLVKMRNEWVAKVDYARIIQKVLQVFCHLARPLTGHEVRFIRLHFDMTQEAFADLFAVSNVAVHKWEKRGSQATNMQWSTEKDLRLFVQLKLSTNPKDLGQLYKELTGRHTIVRKGPAKPLALLTA